ncbi:GNAT family N-acetyltransferase [Bacillus sp. SG-1]|uniref:GNAT family N-acetyltransferase n=1 Tax=Bacillus sp. SG-1 TaxID=161544 RepID=UPI0001543F68|nr:GNAT family N-acetyltransferase [Bacillus sp. SG-1]EDL66775.1 hypothetical protein BSG1_05445 [Bacillus sp. SG-1]
MNIIDVQSQDIQETMLDEFNRSQETKKVVKELDGILYQETDYFIDDWSLERRREIANHFKNVVTEGGAVILAVVEEKVVGFAVIEPASFGKTAVYKELSYIHVAREARGKGIGAYLFTAAKNKAREMGADKLYIGAHPATETQAFYKKMGCTLAKEINTEIFQREKLDIQLEVSVG